MDRRWPIGLNAGFVPPSASRASFRRETVRWTYELEYGQDTLEIQKDAIKPGATSDYRG